MGKGYYFLGADGQFVAVKLKSEVNGKETGRKAIGLPYMGQSLKTKNMVIAAADGHEFSPELVIAQKKKQKDKLDPKFHKELEQWEEVRDCRVQVVDESKIAGQYSVAWKDEQNRWRITPKGQARREDDPVAHGELDYVTMPSGTIRVGKSHMAIANYLYFVRYAGEVQFYQSFIYRYNNKSMTYAPPPELYRQAGFDPTGSKQGEFEKCE